MAASTSQAAHRVQSDSPLSQAAPPTPAAETDDTQDSLAPQNFVSFSVLCMHDFNSEDAGLMSFRKNEVLDIIKRDESGWWAAIRQEGPNEPSVGWIPQAYVTVLSEETAIKLRSMKDHSRNRDRIVDYHVFSVNATQAVPVDGFPSSSTIAEDDSPFQRYAFPSSHGSTDRLSFDSDGTSQSFSTSTSSAVPLPPSRSASFKKNWKPQTSFPEGTRPRAGSLTPGRSTRRHHMHSNELLSRPSNVEMSKPRELTKKPSSNLLGAVESLHKRTVADDNTPGHKAGQDAPVPHLRAPGLRIMPKYELDEDDKGHVRSGTLPALIERLTLEMPTDSTKILESKAFSDIFLMTFRTFMTPNALFDMLLERYYALPPSDLPESTNSDTQVRSSLRLRILEIFTAWLEEHRLLDEEPYIAGRLTEFLRGIDDPSLTGSAESMIQAIQRLTFNTPSKLATTISPKKARKSKAHKNELSKMDPVDIAEQLTLLEFGLYVKISPQECLAYAKIQSGTTVSNLVEFCGTHDKLASWVKSSVLHNDALSKRADVVDFWIKVAEKCRVLNNFSSMAAIVTALSATVLTHLHMTWGHVSRKSTLDALLRYNEPTRGFSGYRTLLQQTEGSCVPFITMYLTDIMHANQHSMEESDIIFFFQRARWHEVISQMLKFQSRPYRIAPSETTTQFIDAYLREVLWDDDWFWQRSRELQNAEAAHADIRKGLTAAGF